MNIKRSFSLLMVLTLCLGMLSMICLPAAAANPVFIIDPSGTDGSTATQNGVTGTVYTSYAAFEAAYTGTTAADVHFVKGTYNDGFTVTKKVNLYGPKKGVDPNVKYDDILKPWTRNSERDSGEAIIAGKVEIKTTGAGNDVLMDGFTISKAGQIWVSCSKEDHDVTIQNIVVSKLCTATDYCFWASPELNNSSIPAAIAYKMTFNLKNVYANLSGGDATAFSTSAFIRYIAAQQAVLDNIYFANSTAKFLLTTAASNVKNDFVMKNSFLYNNIPTEALPAPFASKPLTTIYHDNPSKDVALPSVAYTNNVFYNAHGTDGYSLYFARLNADADTRTFEGNTFVTEQGAVAPINALEKVNDPVTSYDASKIIVKNNRMIGYTYTFAANDSNNRCTGAIALGDNFTWIPTDATATLDFSTTAKCQALVGVAPVASGNVDVDVDGLYFQDFDLTTKVEKVNEAFIIDPDKPNGSTETIDDRTATVYQTYADFETAYTGSDEVDVFFKAGTVAGFTVTKKVNLYGAKYGIDPNVKGNGVLDEWTRNSKRDSGETIITGTVQITTTGADNDVLLDGFTISEAGQIWVNCSSEEHDVTIQNIVVSKNAVAADYCICAAPTYADGSIPSAKAYKMTLNIKNIYADGYQGTGAFIRYIAAQQAVLDNICYKNSSKMFLQTTAAGTTKNEFVMKNSFLYNNIVTTTPISPFQKKSKTTIFFDSPSGNSVKTTSITYKDNVFYNAYGTDGYTIYTDRLSATTDTRTFEGNTFVIESGAVAPICVMERFMSPITNHDLSSIVVKNNRMVGYTYTIRVNNSGAIASTGTVDLSDNFTAAYAADTQDMEGVAPTIDGNITANVSGPYYTNFDMTISTDMLRVTGVDLGSVVIDGTTISGLLEKDNYVPTFTYTCGNDIPRTMTIKNASGTTVSSINAAGTYTVTLGYGSQSRTYTLVVQKTTVYQGAGYMFDPGATKDSAYYWDGQPQKFIFGTNLFNDLTKLFEKADADNVTVPQVLLAPTTIAGDYTISHSCEVLGYHHGVNPVVRVDDPTQPDTLSTKRGENESIITGKWTIEYAANDLTFIFDGITLKGDGRFMDNGNGKLGETVTFQNIICSAGKLSTATGENARFGTKAYSEKALTFMNIWMDGLTLNSSNKTDSQIFYFTGSDVVADNLYMANTDLLLCANIFLQSGTNHTRDLSMTIQNSKFYNATAARWLKLNGEESGSYRKFAGRDSVKFTVQDSIFYNCADSDNSNPNGNANIVVNYSYPCFNFEIKDNSFVEDREVYHFLTDDKNIGTDVYNQFIHFVPQNHGEGGVNNKSNLSENFTIEGNRFIGRNTIVNSENDLFNGSIELENNFFVSYETVQKSKATSNWVTKLKGENPNEVMNVRNTKNGVESYYLDYAMSVSSTDMGASIGSVDRVHKVIELTKTSGTLGVAELKTNSSKPAIYTDAACTNQLTSKIDCDALSDGTHIYYLEYASTADTSITDVYTLVLHTATTETVYPDAKMYDPLAAGLPAGIKWYRTMNGKLYAFETGKTVFGDVDDIVVHTQTATPNVLLPAGTYTASELQTVESVNYICDKNATYPTSVSKKTEKIKVICLGDSITLGTGVTDRTNDAYPAQLQKILDENHADEYEVINYGRGGSLGSNVSTYGYESLWNYSLALKENPDIVILAFGANDAVKTTHGRVAVDNFKKDMLEMIADFQALPSKPIIYMTTTTDVQTTDTGRPQALLTELREIQRETVEEAGIHLLDAYTYSLGWIAQEGAANVYNHATDTVHFNELGYSMMVSDYYDDGIDWTEQGAHQPDSVSITFTTLDTSMAQIGSAKYETLKDALEAAKSGETVKLLKATTEDVVQVNPGVILDLNGYGLTADYVIGFKSSAVYDSDSSNKGRLYVAKDHVFLDSSNGSILPVYDATHECYKLISVNMRQVLSGSKFTFAPKFESFANNAIAAGASTSGIRVVVRVSWSDTSYTAVQDFTYLDSFVKEVIDSYVSSKNDYKQAFTATIKRTDTSISDLTISAAVISETGVELASEKLSYTVQ